MMELLGMMPRKIALGGPYSRDLFNRYGGLRHVRRLRFWPIRKVFIQKYEFSEKDADDMVSFLIHIPDFVPEKRPSAAQCILHPWMTGGSLVLEPSLHLDTDVGISMKKNSLNNLESGPSKESYSSIFNSHSVFTPGNQMNLPPLSWPSNASASALSTLDNICSPGPPCHNTCISN